MINFKNLEDAFKYFIFLGIKVGGLSKKNKKG